ncbi:MAG TPA: DUF4157 domain-containing protein [Solirubrobacteraceae bacterium]
MDPELEQDVERARAVRVPEVVASERVHDRRGGLERAASEIGNRDFTQLVARMQDGEGILPSGLVHPDVEAAIAASRGGGRRLDSGVRSNLEGAFGESMKEVRVHTGPEAAALTRAVSARAFTVGNDIFFSEGEYNPGSSAGTELIAHEAAHAVQQRGAPLSGPLTVSQPGDAMEREAEAMARDIAG